MIRFLSIGYSRMQLHPQLLHRRYLEKEAGLNGEKLVACKPEEYFKLGFEEKIRFFRIFKKIFFTSDNCLILWLSIATQLSTNLLLAWNQFLFLDEQMIRYILTTPGFNSCRCNNFGTLSKYDDDGSENVVKKMNLPSFKLNRVYLDPPNMSNEGDFSWSWILKDFIQVQKEEGKFVFVCPRPP